MDNKAPTEMDTFLPQDGSNAKDGVFKYKVQVAPQDMETGQGDGKSFDPFSERRVDNPTTDGDTLTHLLKAALGTGILSMPIAFKNAGLIVGIFATVLVAFVCTHCAYILVKCAHVLYYKTRRTKMSFADVAEVAFATGPQWGRKFSKPIRYLIQISLFATYFGTCSVYTVIVAANFNQIIKYYKEEGSGEFSLRLMAICLLIPMILLSWIPNLKYLAPVSMVANIFMGTGLGITFQEPNSILIITIKNENFVTTLFLTQQDEHSELWDGPTTKVEIAPEMFGVDTALPIIELEQFFISFMTENKNSIIWYDTIDITQTSLHKKLYELVKITNCQTLSPTNIMHKIRLIKSQSEIDLMKKSCKIISAAMSKTIKISKPKMNEHHLFATVDYECRMNGAEFLAYPPVVAGGKNANIIHYITNNQIIQDGDMVLMDAGCEYHGYSSDVTRTWPINGTFTQEQKILYEIVLDIQNILIHKLKELPSLDQLYHDMCSLLGKRLQECGLIPKHLNKKELFSTVYSYCPHHVSHYLGMDVHDTGKISRNLKLQPGIIITIEPGIYVNPKNQFAPPEFVGLAVRIEDDILITENGPIILTEDCPKEIFKIEALASQ